MSEHTHTHTGSVRANESRLLIALAITGLMTVVELVGGILSNSLALLGDAGHMFTDTLALGLSFFALNLAKKPPDGSKTFGYLRAEILAALINGTILILISIFIFYEACQRFVEPPEVHGGLMLIVAVIGLVANLIGISVLRSGSHDNLNVKGAFLHMWGDTLSSLGVITAGIIILVAGWNIADPIISIVIGLIILRGASRLVWESVNILLEAVPKHLAVNRIIEEVKGIDGLRDIHDVHVWTITSGVYALSAHLLIEDQMISHAADISKKVDEVISEKFGIGHSTLQLESKACEASPVCHINGKINETRNSKHH